MTVEIALFCERISSNWVCHTENIHCRTGSAWKLCKNWKGRVKQVCRTDSNHYPMKGLLKKSNKKWNENKIENSSGVFYLNLTSFLTSFFYWGVFYLEKSTIRFFDSIFESIRFDFRFGSIRFSNLRIEVLSKISNHPEIMKKYPLVIINTH